jgi:hypothetical protein
MHCGEEGTEAAHPISLNNLKKMGKGDKNNKIDYI